MFECVLVDTIYWKQLDGFCFSLTRCRCNKTTIGLKFFFLHFVKLYTSKEQSKANHTKIFIITTYDIRQPKAG